MKTMAGQGRGEDGFLAEWGSGIVVHLIPLPPAASFIPIRHLAFKIKFSLIRSFEVEFRNEGITRLNLAAKLICGSQLSRLK